jgi:hypothetical protein
MIIKIKLQPISYFVLLASLTGTAQAAIPAGENQIQIETSTPKRNGETAFSSFVSWKAEKGPFNKANSLVFIKGSDLPKPMSDVDVANKFAHSLNAAINYEAPRERGAIADYQSGSTKVLVSNRANFNLARFTVRDYTNQKLHYSVPNKRFDEAVAGVAIDFVYAADIDYIDGFSTKQQAKTAGGTVTITIDNDQPIILSTAGKSTRELEKELVGKLGSRAKFSSVPIFPNFVELKSRNYKPFDGGETQLPAFNARSITIDIDDVGLGVLTKFSFSSIKEADKGTGMMTYLIALLAASGLGYFFYTKKKNQTEVV